MNTKSEDVIQHSALDKMIIGHSPVILQLKQLILQSGTSHSTVLIEGESGTGRELVTRALHQYSPHSGTSFIAINCANLQEQLFESELFGHQQGTFTGAA